MAKPTKINFCSFCGKPQGEVKKMKSFVTSKGTKIEKTGKFKIIDISDQKDSRTYKITL